MHQHEPSPSPEGARRRGLFSGKGEHAAPSSYALSDRTEAVMSAYHDMIREQLEEGLRELQHTANQLMREIAGEVWRTAGGDRGEVQGKLLEAISRDQTIRSLIAHTDERFQTLAVRTARLEDTLNMVAEGMRTAQRQIARGATALGDVQTSETILGGDDIRQRLDEVTRQIALAFETLAERDRAITESVQRQVRDHGQLVATETARISQAMESYVQQGVQAMGQLAGRVDSQASTLSSREQEIDARIGLAAEAQLEALEEKLRTISDRIASDVTTMNQAMTHMLDTTDERNRSLGEFLELMNDRVGMETRDVLMAIENMESRAADQVKTAIDERMTRVEITAHDAAVHSAREVTRTLETRVMGLAELVRSDSTALREELVRSAAAQDERVGQLLEERLAHVSESLTSATGWMVEEIVRRIRDESMQTIRTSLDDALTAMDRNMIRISDALEGQIDRLTRTVGDRASEAASQAAGSAADIAIRSRFDDVVARLHESVTAVDRASDMIAHSSTQTEETVMSAMDARIGGLAKMVRSDNESLARQIVADQEASKQALRAMKELQASLPADVIETVQRRMDDLAESVAKSQEMLAQRIDRMAAKIGERYDNDIQIVIDRMGDAMHALAGLGRTPQMDGGNGDRIELE
jgi:hypothetical protein